MSKNLTIVATALRRIQEEGDEGRSLFIQSNCFLNLTMI